MPNTHRTIAPRRTWIFVRSLTAEEKAERLGEWVIREDRFGCWRAFHEDGRKTPLKGSLTAAQEDAINNRCVCPRWPNCQHHDVDHCCQQAAMIRDTEAAKQELYR